MSYNDGNASKPLFSKMNNFQETQKTDFKSSYFFLICDHLHNDATLGCKYSVYIENYKKIAYIFEKNQFFNYMRFWKSSNQQIISFNEVLINVD